MKDNKKYIKWIVFLVMNTIIGFLWLDSDILIKLSKLNIYKISLDFEFLPTFVLSALFSITDKVNIKKKLMNFLMRVIVGIFVVFVVVILYTAYMLSKID